MDTCVPAYWPLAIPSTSLPSDFVPIILLIKVLQLRTIVLLKVLNIQLTLKCLRPVPNWVDITMQYLSDDSHVAILSWKAMFMAIFRSCRRIPWRQIDIKRSFQSEANRPLFNRFGEGWWVPARWGPSYVWTWLKGVRKWTNFNWFMCGHQMRTPPREQTDTTVNISFP